MNRDQVIYLCDDDADVRAALSFLLRQHGMFVSTHASGAALLSEIDAAPKPLRAVFILDIRMEPMSGQDVHEQLLLRGMGSLNPVIFLSGHSDIPIAVKAMNKGAFNFVEKPYTDDALVPLLRDALELEVEWHAQGQRRSVLASLLDSLTPQQRRVMPLVSAGILNKLIADKLNLSVRAIEDHRAKLFDKLGVGSAAELATLLAEMLACGLDLSDASTSGSKEKSVD
jgi:two-component system response regulator DctR